MAGEHVDIHAARVKKLAEQEEEEMTRYTDKELQDDWEFKIVRSSSRAFRDQDLFAALLEEESLAGWELVEKLDDRRIRFKRLRSQRDKDHRLPPGLDPYRTQFGSSSNAPVVAVIVALLLALGLGVVFLFLMA